MTRPSGRLLSNYFVSGAGTSVQDLVFTVTEKPCFTRKQFSLIFYRGAIGEVGGVIRTPRFKYTIVFAYGELITPRGRALEKKKLEEQCPRGHCPPEQSPPMSPGTLRGARLVERNRMLRESAAVGSDRNGDQYSHYLRSAPPQ